MPKKNIDSCLNTEKSTVFNKLIAPVKDFIIEQNEKLPKPPQQKYEYYDFFILLIYYFTTGGSSLKLLVNGQLNQGFLAPSLGIKPVPYSTLNDAFGRFSPDLFRNVFQYLVAHLPFKKVPELAKLGILYCIDGSLFPVINSMMWAGYKSNNNALKLHLCFELNRMIAVDFLVGSGNSSEREALKNMLVQGATYIADRGYMSFSLCHDVVRMNAHFVFRVKSSLLFTVKKKLNILLPISVQNLFEDVTDELINYTNDPHNHTYRLVRFSVLSEHYYILTNRIGLTTFQIIMLYAYRWQVELLFRYLKRTIGSIHLIKHDQKGVTIQFYTLMITALLTLYLKQETINTAMMEYNNKDVGGTKYPVATTKNKVNTKNSRLSSGAEFVTILGNGVKKYWKIGIYWLTALRELLSKPYNIRAIAILGKL